VAGERRAAGAAGGRDPGSRKVGSKVVRAHQAGEGRQWRAVGSRVRRVCR